MERRVSPEHQNVFPILLSGTGKASLPFAFSDIATSDLSLVDGSHLKAAIFNLLKIFYRDYPEIIQHLQTSKKRFFQSHEINHTEPSDRLLIEGTSLVNTPSTLFSVSSLSSANEHDLTTDSNTSSSSSSSYNLDTL